MIDTLSCAMRNIIRKKSRAALTMIGIIIGVTSVIIISCISACGTTAVNNELDSLGLSGMNITIKEGKKLPLTNAELELISTNSSIDSATPVMALPSSFLLGDDSTDVITWGINETAQETVSLKVLYGRFFDKNDIASSARVCMVDKAFSNQNFSTDNIVGKTVRVNINGAVEDYSVVGVLKTGSGMLQNALSGYVPSFVYIPYTTAAEITGQSNYNQIITKLDSGVDIDELSGRITQTLNSSQGVDDGYTASNMAKQRDVLANILGIVTLILTAIGAISLIVAGLSIMTVMLVSVSERKREIGIKKSIGASKKKIVSEFLSEAFLLSFIGSIIGVILGLVISYIGTSIMEMTLIADWKYIVFTILFATISGIVFGVYPSIKAAKLKPIDALKYE
ncbi:MULTISPECIES: ABC transporter permease [unclassified Ruminococcus]|uniref:ABC transporter permease n=1 Tax=unclassified Ruminococcus TaxID=2608920 RepID=UPI00210DA1BF|nr:MULTISPECIES: ABC transporter permease [unclassified Ruminococcus]